MPHYSVARLTGEWQHSWHDDIVSWPIPHETTDMLLYNLVKLPINSIHWMQLQAIGKTYRFLIVRCYVGHLTRTGRQNARFTHRNVFYGLSMRQSKHISYWLRKACIRKEYLVSMRPSLLFVAWTSHQLRFHRSSHTPIARRRLNKTQSEGE